MFAAAYVADFTQRGGPVHRKAAWERLMTSLYSYLSPNTAHIDHIYNLIKDAFYNTSLLIKLNVRSEAQLQKLAPTCT